MRIKIISLGLSFIFLFGCAASVKHYLQYDIALEEVERSSEAKELHGEQKISATWGEGYEYMFEDEMIKISWLASPVELRFLLENKTNDSIKIKWNEAAYVCEKGESHRLMRAGVKYIDRDRLQLPSVVDPKGELTDFVYPSDYLDYSYEGWVERPFISAGWDVKPLLPYSKAGGDPQDFLNGAKDYIGKTMQVLLPVQYEDATYVYIFIFKVKDVNLATK